MLRNILFATLLTTLGLGCSNEETAGTLSQPPYDRLTDSIADAPRRADLYYKRGTLLYRNNELKLAEADVRKAWEIEPQPQYALDLVTVLKQQNQTDAAISFLEEAAKKFPESVHIKVALAQGYMSKNDNSRALVITKNILANYPNNIDALLMQADIYSAENKANESITVLQQAYTMAPGDAELAHKLAFAYAEARNPAVLSLADSLIAADGSGKIAEPYYFKGVYYTNIGQTAAAVQEFDKAIRADYNFLDAYINKGIAYYDAKQWKEATATFNQALRISPDEADPYYWLAKTQDATGNREEAKLNYQRAYSLDKTLTVAKEAAERL